MAGSSGLLIFWRVCKMCLNYTPYYALYYVLHLKSLPVRQMKWKVSIENGSEPELQATTSERVSNESWAPAVSPTYRWDMIVSFRHSLTCFMDNVRQSSIAIDDRVRYLSNSIIIEVWRSNFDHQKLPNWPVLSDNYSVLCVSNLQCNSQYNLLNLLWIFSIG